MSSKVRYSCAIGFVEFGFHLAASVVEQDGDIAKLAVVHFLTTHVVDLRGRHVERSRHRTLRRSRRSSLRAQPALQLARELIERRLGRDFIQLPGELAQPIELFGRAQLLRVGNRSFDPALHDRLGAQPQVVELPVGLPELVGVALLGFDRVASLLGHGVLEQRVWGWPAVPIRPNRHFDRTQRGTSGRSEQPEDERLRESQSRQRTGMQTGRRPP